MLKTLSGKSTAFRGTLFASIAMAFAGLGDALLYPVLPVYADALGLSSLWVGILLSVNRFVRIPGNFLIALGLSKYGNKKMIIGAMSVAVITTAFYGMGWSLWSFLLLRICWGLSYSGLRISSLTYAAAAKSEQNLLFGMNVSIKTLGAAVALFLGPILIKAFSIKVAFLIMALISSIGFFFAYQLPKIKTQLSASKKIFSKKISISGLLLFFTSFSVDGILVVLISKILFVDGKSAVQVVALAGAYLLYRKLCAAFVPIPIGILADRIGLLPVFKFALVATSISLFVIGASFTEIGIMGAFLFNSIIVSMSPAVALRESSGSQLGTLAAITTWWDVGAASGTLLGLSLLDYLGSSFLFWGLAGVVLGVSVLFFYRFD